ncbi:hypothetical protein KM043_006250 [Ampulex compressa]|nr:hypothetical protein KM043_006250 [Ampulex compressa]
MHEFSLRGQEKTSFGLGVDKPYGGAKRASPSSNREGRGDTDLGGCDGPSPGTSIPPHAYLRYFLRRAFLSSSFGAISPTFVPTSSTVLCSAAYSRDSNEYDVRVDQSTRPVGIKKPLVGKYSRKVEFRRTCFDRVRTGKDDDVGVG